MAATSFTRENATEKSCVWCGQTFIPWQYAQQACSYRCGYMSINARRAAERAATLPPRAVDSCLRCGGDMSHKRRDAIYCSKTCKSMDHTAKHRGNRTRLVGTARRREIYERDGGRCYSCGESVSLKECEMDHLIPVNDGGSSHPTNVATSCRFCNRSRGTKITTAVVRKLMELKA